MSIMIRNFIERIERKKDSVTYWRKKGARIGDNCVIFPEAYLGSEPYLVSIGDNVRITNGVNIITHDGGVWVLRHLKKELSNVDIVNNVIIGNNVHIGSNAVIMPGVKVGNNVIIGCGAIVTKNIPDNLIVAGIPAKPIETIEDYYNKHKPDFIHTKNMSTEEKRAFLLAKFRCDLTKE